MASNSNTLQDGPTKQLQPPTRTKHRQSIKPPLVKQAVIAHALLGANNSQIAQELKIDRSTVKTILSSVEIQQHIEEGRSDCVRMIPRSVRVIGDKLKKGSETAALAILRGTQVLQNQQVIGTQLNMQANTWITMRQQKQAEDAQVIEAECVKPVENTPSNSIPTLPPSKS